MVVAINFSYFLIDKYGMMGGAASFFLASMVRTIVQFIKVKDLLNLTVVSLLPWANIMKTIVCSVIASAFPFIIISQYMSNIVTIIISSAGYSLILLYFYIYTGILDYQKVIKFAKFTIGQK